MSHKPGPKEAARAVVDLLARSGFAIPQALSLEIVATVDGFTDWDSMASAIRGGHHLTPAVLDADLGPVVPDSQGPFKVYAGDVYYDTLPEYSRACAAASLRASDNIDADGRLCRVQNAQGALVAGYIAHDCTIHTFGGSALDEMPPMSQLGQYIAQMWDDENVVADEDQLRIHLCDSLEFALKTDNDSFMGYCQYERTESGRVLNLVPPIIPAYYRQAGVFQVNPGLPDNLRLSLEKVLSQ